jgi:hypothetical protein
MNLKKLAIGAVLAATVASAAAYTKYYTTIAYYSDATYSNVVGYKTTNCENTVEVSGTVTPYSRTIERFRCDGPIP